METYNDKWAEHQPEQPEEQAEVVLPADLDTEQFTDQQLLYLSAFFEDWRGRLVRKLVYFLAMASASGRERACVLDYFLNRRTFKVREAFRYYGISQNTFMKVKKELLPLLEEKSKTLRSVFEVKKMPVYKQRTGNGQTKKPKQKELFEHE